VITTLNGVKVLVTGVSGFIGSHLAQRLIRDGSEVYGLDKEITNSWRIQNLHNQIKLHSVNLVDYASVRKVVQEVKPQKIFHLAAYVDVSRSFAVVDEMIDINIKGTLNLLRALDETGYDCFINIGTCEEYGDNPVPFKEDQIPNPVSPYSASKVATTMFCQMLNKTMRLPIVTLRPFLVYGPGQINNMLIPSVISTAIKNQEIEVTGGEQTREFNYVDDIVDGFTKAAVIPEAIGEIINIGNGKEYRIKDVVELVIKLLNSKTKPKYGALKYRPGETMHFYCDNQKAREILHWKPNVGLEDGLRTTISWFQKYYDRENR